MNHDDILLIGFILMAISSIWAFLLGTRVLVTWYVHYYGSAALFGLALIVIYFGLEK